MSKKTVSGAKEWAPHSLNSMYGCSHGCLYCYAHSMAARFKRLGDGGWTAERPRAVGRVGLKRGSIMYPTTHDLTPTNMGHTLPVLDRALFAGNKVLVVSKPHIQVIDKITSSMEQYRQSVLFRFTIGSPDSSTLAFWEPGAPTFHERLACLKMAHDRGWRTSVSMEPLLARSVNEALHLVFLVEPHVTEDVWIGALNMGRLRLRTNGHLNEETGRALDSLASYWNAGRWDELARALGDHPLVKWKESVKAVLGRELPSEADDSWARG